ncbi:MAG: YkgJ family cysteine cluster protein [Candidatus Kariarchaeaceae archaeon]
MGSNNQKIGVSCHFNCHICCLETEMTLTNEEIHRITSLGYPVESFCFVTPDNFIQLKNQNGRCVFLGEDNYCSIYEDRPSGCRFYPLIWDMDLEEAVIDDDCAQKAFFEKRLKQLSTEANVKQLSALINQFIDELEDRTGQFFEEE